MLSGFTGCDEMTELWIVIIFSCYDTTDWTHTHADKHTHTGSGGKTQATFLTTGATSCLLSILS